ncbi:hypothetical protein [Corynebacterium glyciniphilum]|uniref:hypothetical protein n=1 Tax=Corynebacterium glyciniphilum TaxID=1404244 RepID=UPI002656650C|nr:hypothetical protein [Corynebacterium glyciniphilum]MDN6707409.1 hypothetical protein [Corynebacterium glyciniphilum]
MTTTLPHLITLHPTDGTDQWNWCISVDQAPAIHFRNITHAATTLSYLLDDMESGVDITTAEALDFAAMEAIRPADFGTVRYEVIQEAKDA